MEDRSEGLRIGHEPAPGGGARPFGRDRGRSGIHELMLERCLLSKQRDDFGDMSIVSSVLFIWAASIVGAFSGEFESWRLNSSLGNV